MYCESYYAVYFERYSVVLGHFPKASCAKHLLVTISSFLRKYTSTLVFGIFNISKTNRITTQYPYGTYLQILTEKITEKSHNSQRKATFLNYYEGFKLLMKVFSFS